MLAAAALGALGAQLKQLQAAKADWFVGANLVDKQDISLQADGALLLCVGSPSTGRSATVRAWTPLPKRRPLGRCKPPITTK